jgi:hypothetical protein
MPTSEKKPRNLTVVAQDLAEEIGGIRNLLMEIEAMCLDHEEDCGKHKYMLRARAFHEAGDCIRMAMERLEYVE